MYTNYEANKHYVRERLEARYQESARHRQIRQSKIGQPKASAAARLTAWLLRWLQRPRRTTSDRRDEEISPIGGLQM